MCLFQTKFTKPIFCISHTIAHHAPVKLLSTPSHTLVDVASRFKEAEPLTTKEAREVAGVLERIYSQSPLSWPKLLQVDPGREFMGAVNQLLSKHNVDVRRGCVDIHRDQAIVERFNRTLAERLFGHKIWG